jgi:prephenate dehydratase
MIKIGYQGDVGSNNNKAFEEFVKRNLITNAIGFPLFTSANVVNSLISNDIEYGVMALSNVIAGIVVETDFALKNLNYQIIEKLDLQIKHSLAVKPDVSFDLIKKVCSHPQALSQCTNWINANLPGASTIPYIDTAKAAKDLESGLISPDTAVICSPLAAKIYNLNVINENISNLENNFTTFILIKLIK